MKNPSFCPSTQRPEGIWPILYHYIHTSKYYPPPKYRLKSSLPGSIIATKRFFALGEKTPSPGRTLHHKHPDGGVDQQRDLVPRDGARCGVCHSYKRPAQSHFPGLWTCKEAPPPLLLGRKKMTSLLERVATPGTSDPICL